MNSEESARKLEIETRRRKNIRIGMRKAAQKGYPIGRPRDEVSIEKYLAKAYVKRVQEALSAGLSLREAARFAGVAVNTVRKVKAITTSQLDSPGQPNPNYNTVSSGQVKAACRANRRDERERKHHAALFTRSDLPNDLNDAYYFCLRQFRLHWDHDWTWGGRGEIAYFSSVDLYYLFRIGQAKIYLGSTPQQVEENLLAYLNIGYDNPIQRIHPTTDEVSLLAHLAQQPSEIARVEVDHDGALLFLSLVNKALLWLPNPSRPFYQITEDGQALLLALAQRTDF